MSGAWNRRRAAWTGLALIVATNVVALGGVAWNRLGELDSRLALTERELPTTRLWYSRASENSGMSLTLRWRVLPDDTDDDAPYVPEQGDFGGTRWLGVAKMTALGFDAPVAADLAPRAPGSRDRSRYERQPDRTVYLVLEMDGPAYREALRRAAQADRRASDADGQTRLAHERDDASRLFVVDAGLDRAALRARYPDRALYAITTGRIGTHADGDGKPAGGRVRALAVDEINVPLALRPVFERSTSRDVDLTMVVGPRGEPWLAAAATHAASQAAPGR